MTEKANMIEAYLMGDLQGIEKADFEKLMANDPSFRQEVQLQDEIITSLREERAGNIRTRLQAIDVNSGVQYGNVVKIAASFTIAAIIGTGAYFLFNNSSEQTPDQLTENSNVITENANRDIDTKDSKNTVTPSVDLKEEIANNENEISDNTNIAEPEVTPRVITAPTPTDKSTERAVVNVPDVNNMNDDDSPLLNDGGGLPTNNGKNFDPSSTKFVNENVEIKNDGSDFHYKFKDGKLTLFGNFLDPKPCVLEYKLNNATTHYLYYNNEVYSIKDASQKTPLKAVTDKTLKKQLKKEFSGCQPIEN